MKLTEILTNEELRRHEFPVVKESTFLSHAAVCPLPRRVAEAVNSYATACTLGDQEDQIPSGLVRETRELTAKFLGAQSDEIALVGSTSQGMSYVAAGLNFRKSDNIIVYQDDFPTNVYPWMALAERGVQVRFLNVKQLGRIRPIDILGQVDESTRLVALTSCHYISGWRVELNAIGRLLHERRILFAVDGIQTLGAFPTPIDHVDFLAADAHKWLLGPLAAGILYVRKDRQEIVKPLVHGWANVECPDYVAQSGLAFRPGARRYEAGSLNILGIAGLHASLKLIDEIGVDAIAKELLRKRKLLVDGLMAKGWGVLMPDAPEANASGIVSFFGDDAETKSLWGKLGAAKISTSLRSTRDGKKFIRVSPHFYNSDAELQRMLELA